MDIVVRQFPERIRHAIELLSELVFLGAAAVLLVFAWPVIERLVAFDQRSMAANMPLAIPHAAIPIGIACMAVLTIARLVTGRWREPRSQGTSH
jgi:TRAP-type C4-dicarboxylate transport system permease small subunit